MGQSIELERLVARWSEHIPTKFTLHDTVYDSQQQSSALVCICNCKDVDDVKLRVKDTSDVGGHNDPNSRVCRRSPGQITQMAPKSTLE